MTARQGRPAQFFERKRSRTARSPRGRAQGHAVLTCTWTLVMSGTASIGSQTVRPRAPRATSTTAAPSRMSRPLADGVFDEAREHESALVGAGLAGSQKCSSASHNAQTPFVTMRCPRRSPSAGRTRRRRWRGPPSFTAVRSQPPFST